MALSLLKHVDMSWIPKQANQTYKDLLIQWQERALKFNGLKIGDSKRDTIEHMFHGRKEDRGYNSRWGMFLIQLRPPTDIKRNTYGVLEFAGNKPELEANGSSISEPGMKTSIGRDDEKHRKVARGRLPRAATPHPIRVRKPPQKRA